MSTTCTRCEGTGFINLHQVDDHKITEFESSPDPLLYMITWIGANDKHDVSVCDCCGDGEYWYGLAGEHYNRDDPLGPDGPYGYNGGLCECH